MYVLKHLLKRAMPGLGVIAVFAIMFTGFQPLVTATAQPATASSPSSESGSVDISLITRDPEDGHLLTDACYELVDYSNEGCDENGDGQVTFADIPFGKYSVHQTQAPTGYPTINDFEIDVQPQGDPNIHTVAVPLSFVIKQAPDQNEPDTRNVSVVLIDLTTSEKAVIDGCMQIVDASNMGCDEDVRDGQIDFLDVPAGGPYDLQFELPDGYQSIPGVDPHSIEVDASADVPSNQFVLVYVFAAPTDSGGGSGSATLDITLRGCPEGITPHSVDPAVECTIPLDAPATAGVYWGGDGQGGLPMMDVERLYDGSYHVPVPANVPISIFNLEPDVRDDFMALGANGIDGAGDPVVVVAPDATGHVYIYYYFESTVSAPSQPSEPAETSEPAADTWTASAQVMMCDSAPGAGATPRCHAQGGIEVNIALLDGEFLGSCATSEPYPTPWGVDISTCSVPGMPFHQDIMAFQDPTTIPTGYTPYQEVQSISVGNLIPGGGDQATFTFINVLTETATSESTSDADTTAATLTITMRGCPEGFNPDTGDFWIECTIPLDAPDNAILIWGGDGQGGMNIAWMDRNYNGAYIYEAGSHTMNLQISGLGPVVRDSYQVFGFDGFTGDTYTINLTDGETREIYVFYWFD